LNNYARGDGKAILRKLDQIIGYFS